MFSLVFSSARLRLKKRNIRFSPLDFSSAVKKKKTVVSAVLLKFLTAPCMTKISAPCPQPAEAFSRHNRRRGAASTRSHVSREWHNRWAVCRAGLEKQAPPVSHYKTGPESLQYSSVRCTQPPPPHRNSCSQASRIEAHTMSLTC